MKVIFNIPDHTNRQNMILALVESGYIVEMKYRKEGLNTIYALEVDVPELIRVEEE